MSKATPTRLFPVAVNHFKYRIFVRSSLSFTVTYTVIKKALQWSLKVFATMTAPRQSDNIEVAACQALLLPKNHKA